MLSSSLPTTHSSAPLTRKSPFSYTCQKCTHCCFHKGIRVNPYEVALLARHIGISTTEFIESYVDITTSFLKHQSDGACVFLTDQGCGVHEDRPLVCRIYPLEQRVTGDGLESFHHVTPHPQTEGVYGQEGTVEDFLITQGLSHFLKVRDRYLALVYRLLDLLAQEVQDNAHSLEITKKAFKDEPTVHQALRKWLDMDIIVDQHCRTQGLPEPDNLEDRLTEYFNAMDSWISQLSQGAHHE